jgi:hypothetical protein
MSINVGDPNGKYESFSFGMNGNGTEGEVYGDVSQGGDIEAQNYLRTNSVQDQVALGRLRLELGDREGYRPWNTCRTYSLKRFDEFRQLFHVNPDFNRLPPRANKPGNPSTNTFPLSSTASDPSR